MLLLADAVAALHAAAVLFMLTGALAALRFPRLLLLHVPVALVILAVNLAGADCPLTTLELHLRDRAGVPRYDGGFLGHYVFGPVGIDVRAQATQAGIYALAIGLNALGYGVLGLRAVRTSSARAASARSTAADADGSGPGPATRRSAPGRGRPRRGRPRRTPAPHAGAHRAGRRTSSRTSAPGRR